MFKIVKPGGIKAFIPKVLVTGPFNAGKSTFVRALSTRSVSVDRMGTTIALDHGHIEYGDVTADIFGTPGQARFDPILLVVYPLQTARPDFPDGLIQPGQLQRIRASGGLDRCQKRLDRQ